MPAATLPSPINWSAVQAILFDLGNVLLDLDNTRYGNGWPTDIGKHHISTMQKLQDEAFFYRYDTGQLSSEEVLQTLSDSFGLSAKQAISYWNEILLPGINPQRYATLEVLRKRYDLYILSNTNDLHIDWVREHVAQAGYADFESRFFKQVFYSQELHALKPEPAIYERAEAKMDRPPAELLFIDDKQENVLAARARGWQAIHLEAGTPMEQVLAPIL